MPPKRKAQNQLSQNPHTAKARDRLVGKSDDEVRIEKAKASDQAAITYRMNQIRETNEWIQGDDATKARIKEAIKDEVTHRR